MSAEAHSEVIVRPVRDVDAEALGRVHAQCWHETYDHLISKAALERVSPRRMAELWTHYSSLGDGRCLYAALVDGEIVGFSGSGPSRDPEVTDRSELYFTYVLHAFHGTGIGQQLFDAVLGEQPAFLGVAVDNPRAHRFYARNGFAPDGARQTQPFLGEVITEVRLVR